MQSSGLFLVDLLQCNACQVELLNIFRAAEGIPAGNHFLCFYGIQLALCWRCITCNVSCAIPGPHVLCGIPR